MSSEDLSSAEGCAPSLAHRLSVKLERTLIPIRDAHLIDTPAILIDLGVVESNVASMQRRADRHGVSLRPHVKSHKIPELARLQLRAGAAGITVAKLGEAEVMAAAGISDIFIANQVLGRARLQRLVGLARNVRLAVGVDSFVGARALNEAVASVQAAGDDHAAPLELLIEIDTGLRRCGLLPGPRVIELARAISDLRGLRLRGIFTHAGHAYAATDRNQVVDISRHESRCLVETAAALCEATQDAVAVVSVGSTPTMKVWEGHVGITELRPGNYIFHDLMQLALGVAEPSECALTVLATVISRPSPERAVIDAGSKVLALDRGAHGNELIRGHGLVIGCRGVLARLSEEHGVLESRPGEELALEIGQTVRIVPNHACPVINLADTALAIRDGHVTGELEIAARGKVR